MGADQLDKGRLRSIWTHGLPAQPQDQQQQQPLLDGQHQHQHQQLHHLHQPQRSARGGGAGGLAEQQQEPDADTPKKLAAAVSFLQASQHVYGGRRRRLFPFTALDREILCNALACAGASMSDPLMSLVDSYYAGKLGTTSLAALGSNGALFSVLYFLCFTALAVLCTQAMASANSRGDSAGCGRGFIQAMTATLAVSCILVLVLVSAPEFLLGLFQTGPEVMALAKTYCKIRALSLPAALVMNVSQAAFRSLLDLTTPFCVVMTANAANYGLNHLLMVVLPYGMAGCGWASVVSQYTGALLFAGLIYRRRHAFGIPEALAGAEDAYYARMQGKHWPAGKPSTGGSTTLVAKRAGKAVPAGSSGSAANSSHHQRQHKAPGLGSPGKRQGGSRRTSRQSSRDVSPRARGSPRRSRESSGTLRIDVTAFEQHLAKYNGAAAPAGEDGTQQDYVLGHSDPHSPARRRGSRLHSASSSADGATTRLGKGAFASAAASAAAAAVMEEGPFAAAQVGATAGGPAAAAADGGGGSGSGFELHRWNSAGSDSKQPRYLVSSSNSAWWRLGVLLRSLDWGGFARRFAGMMTRGGLILSCYTSANVVAARGGTAMMAAHQVVQQQQQLQMSIAWSFLHVGQSMTANLFHSAAVGGGPKAARLLSKRIISWAFTCCASLALLTYAYRRSLPAIFTKDPEVQGLVLGAGLPAVLMLGLGWNNALEGCLLAADEQPYVVRVYPWAVASALGLLACGRVLQAGLPGVWTALMGYYAVLLVGFAARYWVWRGRL